MRELITIPDSKEPVPASQLPEGDVSREELESRWWACVRILLDHRERVLSQVQQAG
jgi:hypothetical protein